MWHTISCIHGLLYLQTNEYTHGAESVFNFLIYKYEVYYVKLAKLPHTVRDPLPPHCESSSQTLFLILLLLLLDW